MTDTTNALLNKFKRPQTKSVTSKRNKKDKLDVALSIFEPDDEHLLEIIQQQKKTKTPKQNTTKSRLTRKCKNNDIESKSIEKCSKKQLTQDKNIKEENREAESTLKISRPNYNIKLPKFDYSNELGHFQDDHFKSEMTNQVIMTRSRAKRF